MGLYLLGIESKPLIYKLLLCCVCSLFCFQSSAEKNPIVDVKLATGGGYFPFVDSNIPVGGWSTKLVKQTVSKINVTTSIEILPWERALKWTNEGQFLGAFPFVYSELRAQEFLFSTPINYVPVHMYVSSQSSFKKPKDLTGKRLCFPLDYELGNSETDIVEKFRMTINRVKDGIGCAKHVQKGWSDAGLTNEYVQVNKLKLGSDQQNEIEILPEELALVPLHFVIPKTNINGQNWMDKFNHGFELLIKSGEKSKIDQQYLKAVSN